MRIVALAAIAVSALLVAPAWHVASSQSTLRVDVNLISIFPTVQDAQGRYLTNLSQNDFRVFEDGIEQKLEVFERDDVPLTLGILVDTSGSMADLLTATRMGILDFAGTYPDPDNFFVESFGINVTLLHDYRRPLKNLEAELRVMQPVGTSSLFDGLIQGMRKAIKSAPQRKALVVFTDGNDNGSSSLFNDVVLEAQRSGVILYFVPIGALIHIDQHTVDTLAAQSGGRVLYLPKSEPIPPALHRIQDELSRQYYLGYYAPRRAGFHQLRVEVPGRDVQVRARTGYRGE